MEQMVRVKETFPDGTATVLLVRESACSGDCHKCSGCGAAKETMIFTAKNAIGAARGDLVKVESATGPVMKAAVVLYVIPLVLFFLGYYLGTLPGNFGALGGCLGFVLGVVLVVIYDRKVVKKSDLGYTITAFAADALIQNMRKEVHDHG
ncbi:MAG: SoxR reducing system RseC family protein [Oscillospiraceae bacterium]|nr:SoxR reducing system RseC family protein [Oscillospiraceae bacterium]